MNKFLLCLFIALPMSSALAEKPSNLMTTDTPQTFAVTQASIQKQMESGGRFEFIKPSDKAAANNDMNSMAAMLQKAGSVEALSSNDKTALFNMQEHLNGLLARNDNQRLVCEHNNPLGSHIPTTTCRTYGEIERQRRDSQRYLDDVANNRAQLQHGN
ncbi:MAG: hypothetical protein ABJB01_05635 [Rudaea sp.]